MTDYLQIQNYLKELPNWRIVDGRLEKEFTFRDFTRAVLFINKIVNPIEDKQIYPHIKMAYNRVILSIFGITAKGLTEREFALAKEIEDLV